jgi:phenylalanyl-tRNA synthetase beta chain
MHDLPQFPGSDRDWTLTIPEELAIEEVFTAINSARSHLLEKLLLLDIHRSEKLGSELKNATFRLFYRDAGKTLSYNEIETEHARIVQSALTKLTTDGKIKSL